MLRSRGLARKRLKIIRLTRVRAVIARGRPIANLGALGVRHAAAVTQVRDEDAGHFGA